jgi:hypothetical protein
MPDEPNGWPGIPSTWPEAPYYAPDAPPAPNADARTETWTGGPVDVAAFDVQTSIMQFDVPGDFPEAPAEAQQAPRLKSQSRDDWGFWE